jgi:endogenous inhibitor of DNA gyrase (YacG/DUF329 family)
MDGTCQRCGKPLERLGRGRPRLFCSPACRKGAQRDRDRPAADERRRAGQFADARAEAARAWRPLEEAAQETADLAGAVLAYATDEDRASLLAKIGELRAAVGDVARLATGYFDASELARSLEEAAPPDAAEPGPAAPH